MINANELRIGNWVWQEDKDHFRRYFQIGSGHDIEEVEDYPEQCSPIPLTPDMLEKCGAEYTDDGYGGHLLPVSPSGSIRLRFDPDWGYYWPPNTGNYINHLHQLQNLVFALTGEELKVYL